jgi:hypothetical protein
MHPPDRLTVPTCIGCGAMGEVGTCETGCSEQRLELVQAVEYDALAALRTRAQTQAQAFLAVAQELARQQPAAGELEPAYRSLQSAARAELRRHRDLEEQDIDLEQPAEPATTWWCPRCGGIDAPQPCLGICIWRPIEWVNRSLYEQERDRALRERERERRLRELLRRVAWITPQAGQWERGWQTLRTDARDTLEACVQASSHAGAGAASSSRP